MRRREWWWYEWAWTRGSSFTKRIMGEAYRVLALAVAAVVTVAALVVIHPVNAQEFIVEVTKTKKTTDTTGGLSLRGLFVFKPPAFVAESDV